MNKKALDALNKLLSLKEGVSKPCAIYGPEIERNFGKTNGTDTFRFMIFDDLFDESVLDGLYQYIINANVHTETRFLEIAPNGEHSDDDKLQILREHKEETSSVVKAYLADLYFNRLSFLVDMSNIGGIEYWGRCKSMESVVTGWHVDCMEDLAMTSHLYVGPTYSTLLYLTEGLGDVIFQVNTTKGDCNVCKGPCKRGEHRHDVLLDDMLWEDERQDINEKEFFKIPYKKGRLVVFNPTLFHRVASKPLGERAVFVAALWDKRWSYKEFFPDKDGRSTLHSLRNNDPA
tara:strand:+ start:6129 stop:6995 length:867 start_codon:yes stop_codon:yes gene_type:complete